MTHQPVQQPQSSDAAGAAAMPAQPHDIQSSATGVSTLPQRTERPFTRYMKGGVLGFIGYILSPLSFWNDLLINVPLALGFAYAITFVLRPFITFSAPGFIVFVIIGYWLTNLLGFYMIRRAADQVTKKYPGRPLHDVGLSLLYTVAIVILGVLGYQESIIQTINIFPSWVAV